MNASIDDSRDVGRNEMCDLIYHGFHILLLRRHALLKEDRLGSSTSTPAVLQPPTLTNKQPTPNYPVLQPIIDLLQYQVFLERIQDEITQVVRALQKAGIPTTLVMNTVGETGKELIKLLDSKASLTVGGEIVLRIFERFVSISPVYLAVTN